MKYFFLCLNKTQMPLTRSQARIQAEQERMKKLEKRIRTPSPKTAPEEGHAGRLGLPFNRYNPRTGDRVSCLKLGNGVYKITFAVKSNPAEAEIPEDENSPLNWMKINPRTRQLEYEGDDTGLVCYLRDHIYAFMEKQ